MARPVRLHVEALEPRALPDATAGLAGGVLAVTGTGGRDRIAVRLDAPAAQLVVTDHGREVGRFAAAGVTSIAIAAGAGDDVVRVARDVTQPATIDGGEGNDVLGAGGGPSTLIGGDGRDKLSGGPAGDQLDGGPGSADDTVLTMEQLAAWRSFQMTTGLRSSPMPSMAMVTRSPC